MLSFLENVSNSEDLLLTTKYNISYTGIFSWDSYSYLFYLCNSIYVHCLHMSALLIN